MSLIVNRNDELQKIIQETIRKQSIPEKLPVSYSPILLTDENIYKIVKDYSNKNIKQKFIAKRYIWEVSNVTNMKLFTHFNEDITNWNISKVTTIAEMFCGAACLHRPINNWYVPNVTDMVRFKLESESVDDESEFEITTASVKNKTKPNETKNVIVHDDDDDVNSEEDSDDSDDSEGSLVDFIVNDNMIETEDDLTSTNDESGLDYVNLIESSNYNRHGVRRSLRRKKQTILFTEQFATDIAKTMLADIPDEELRAVLMNHNSLTSEDEESSLSDSDKDSEFVDDESESESYEKESDEEESDEEESDEEESDEEES